MDAVNEPDNSWQFIDQPIRVRGTGREGLQTALDLVQPRHALARADDEVMQRPPLPGLRILHESRSVGCRLRQCVEIASNLLGCGDRFTRCMTYDGLQRRDTGIVLNSGGETLSTGGHGQKN